MSVKKRVEDYLFRRGYFIITPRTHSFGGFYESLNLGLRICYFLKKKPIYCTVVFSEANYYKSLTSKVFGLKIVGRLIFNEDKFSVFFSILLSLIVNICNILSKLKFYKFLSIFFGSDKVKKIHFKYFGYRGNSFSDFRFINLNDLSNIYKVNVTIYNSILKKIFQKETQIRNSICFVVKDRGYSKILGISNNQVASIKNYKKALNFFIEKKYNISRVGEPSMSEFDFKNSNFFDFTKKKKHFEYLNRQYFSSEFYFGTGASHASVANFFNKRSLITNSICYSLPRIYLKGDFVTFKKIFCLKEKKVLSLEEIFNRVSLATKLHTDNISEKSESIILIDNDEDEILDAARDFLNFSEQKDENELLNKYYEMRKDYILKNKFFTNKDSADFHEFFINCEGSVPKNFLKTYLFQNELLKEISNKIGFELKKKYLI